jgi:hypothetical protein
MREFWPMRFNKRQHIAQTLRFEWSGKQGIITARIRFSLSGPSIGRRAKSAINANSCIQDLLHRLPAKGIIMVETVVKLRLNQQQLELVDRTIAQGVAPDRVSLVRLALREYAAARKADSAIESKR